MKIKTVGITTIACTTFLSFIAQGKEKQPNVLIFMADQQHWDVLVYTGNAEIKTPNIDRLAKEGVYFQNAYSACPVCVPARSVILTGHTIFNVKVLGNNDIENDDIPKIPTFDQILSDNGYRTEYYGKWHVPYQFASKYKNAVKTTGKSKFTNVQTNVDGFGEYPDKIGDAQRPANANELIDNMSLRPYVQLPIDGRFGLKEGNITVDSPGKKVIIQVSHHDLFATILDYTGMKITENDVRSLRNLVDGNADPLEINNLIGANPEKARYEKSAETLKQTLKEWMTKTKTPYIKELEDTKL